jgi:hypothetical protein
VVDPAAAFISTEVVGLGLSLDELEFLDELAFSTDEELEEPGLLDELDDVEDVDGEDFVVEGVEDGLVLLVEKEEDETGFADGEVDEPELGLPSPLAFSAFSFSLAACIFAMRSLSVSPGLDVEGIDADAELLDEEELVLADASMGGSGGGALSSCDTNWSEKNKSNKKPRVLFTDIRPNVGPTHRD